MSYSTNIAISSALISPRSQPKLTPLQTAVLWEIAAVLDEQRVEATVEDPVKLQIPAARLRNPGGRADNWWLRQCLDALTGRKIQSTDRDGGWWTEVIIARAALPAGDEIAEITVMPAGVAALRAPKTFAVIEREAAWSMPPAARRLYAALADKKNLREHRWTYTVDELRSLFHVEGHYQHWKDFRKRVLLPAVEAVNAYGSVHVTMTPLRLSRSINRVRFDWRWKSLDEVRQTEEETSRIHPYAEQPAVGSAPPLLPEKRTERELNERRWWEQLPQAERDRLIAEIRARPFEPLPGLDGAVLLAELPERFVIRAAWEEAHPNEPPYDELPEA